MENIERTQSATLLQGARLQVPTGSLVAGKSLIILYDYQFSGAMNIRRRMGTPCSIWLRHEGG